MKPIEKSFAAISRRSPPKSLADIDYVQASKFFKEQLIDAFIYYAADKPVNWPQISSETEKLHVLADTFRVSETNDALLLQYGSHRSGILHITLRELFGRKFRDNRNAWRMLIRDGEIFSELVMECRQHTLWVEASYRLVKDDAGDTVGILAVQRDITQRKIAVRAHEETEERFERLAHLSFQALFILKRGKIQDVNEAMEKITGHDHENLMQRRVVKSCFTKAVAKALFDKNQPENPESFETIIKRKDKRIVPVEIETQVIPYHDKPMFVVGITDISNRKRIEDEIVKLSIALDQSANEIIISQKDGSIEYVNRAFSTITGYQPSEVIGKNPRFLKSGAHPAEFYKEMWTTLGKGKQWVGELLNRRKDGELFWESATITPIKDKQGEIIRYIAIKEDVTRRKQAEQMLRDSEEKFRSMVSNVPGVVYRCAYDTEWTVLFITDAIEELTGYEARDFQLPSKLSLTSIIHPEDWSMAAEAVQSGISVVGQFSIEYRIITRDNSIKWVSNNGRPMFDEQNTIKWLDGFLLDITDRISALEEMKKAKISAEEANRAKSEFLANISHEIRTPLNAVLGFTELAESLTTDNVQIKYLNSIKSSGKNLMILINDLLDLSKIESGKMTLYNTFFDIRKLLEEVRNVFSMRVALKGMKYVLDLDKRFPQAIKTDEVRLRQILINLVGNAVKFTHQGEIRIVVRSQIVRKAIKPTIRLEMRVIDTGIGIPENSFRIIFESFRQHSQLNSRKYGGTGLGLAITKHLVEVMKGEITVASQLNQGSTFTIVFPEVEYAQVLSDTLEDSYLSPESTQLYELSDLQLIDTRRRQNNFNDQQELGMIDASDYQVLVNRLEQDLAAQWRLYKQKQPLKEIQAFAREIINLGQTYKLTFISDYGQQLLTTMQNFDVEEMRLKLELFPQLLAHLKKDRS